MCILKVKGVVATATFTKLENFGGEGSATFSKHFHTNASSPQRVTIREEGVALTVTDVFRDRPIYYGNPFEQAVVEPLP